VVLSFVVFGSGRWVFGLCYMVCRPFGRWLCFHRCLGFCVVVGSVRVVGVRVPVLLLRFVGWRSVRIGRGFVRFGVVVVVGVSSIVVIGLFVVVTMLLVGCSGGLVFPFWGGVVVVVAVVVVGVVVVVIVVGVVVIVVVVVVVGGVVVYLLGL
jgi:hypothetical protein